LALVALVELDQIAIEAQQVLTLFFLALHQMAAAAAVHLLQIKPACLAVLAAARLLVTPQEEPETHQAHHHRKEITVVLALLL